MPLPEAYDTFDPDEHDLESERLEAVLQRHRLDDLRSLESEADARRRCRRPLPESTWAAHRRAFEKTDPEPPLDDPDGRAEWEWRWLEYYYTQEGLTIALQRHHAERRSFIARQALRERESAESVRWMTEGAKRKKKERKPFVPVPWPQGDGVTEHREAFAWARSHEGYDPRHEAGLQEPSYDRALDLQAALYGWFGSLEPEDRDAAGPLHDAAREAGGDVRSAFKLEYRPGTIGWSMLQLRDGLEHLQELLAILDDCAGCAWLTPEAHARLHEIAVALEAAALDRYTYLRSLYDGYLERVVRVLGGTKWEPPPDGLTPVPPPDDA